MLVVRCLWLIGRCEEMEVKIWGSDGGEDGTMNYLMLSIWQFGRWGGRISGIDVCCFWSTARVSGCYRV